MNEVDVSLKPGGGGIDPRLETHEVGLRHRPEAPNLPSRFVPHIPEPIVEVCPEPRKGLILPLP